MYYNCQYLLSNIVQTIWPLLKPTRQDNWFYWIIKSMTCGSVNPAEGEERKDDCNLVTLWCPSGFVELHPWGHVFGVIAPWRSQGWLKIKKHNSSLIPHVFILDGYMLNMDNLACKLNGRVQDIQGKTDEPCYVCFSPISWHHFMELHKFHWTF